jgi:hypothetical protein
LLIYDFLMPRRIWLSILKPIVTPLHTLRQYLTKTPKNFVPRNLQVFHVLNRLCNTYPSNVLLWFFFFNCVHSLKT